MIFLASCGGCERFFRVTVAPPEMLLLRDMMSEQQPDHLGNCPKCRSFPLHMQEDESAVQSDTVVMSLTMTELYQAAYGMPLKDEEPTLPKLQDLMKVGKFVDLDIHMNGPVMILEAIRFETGTIHLCGSGRGAQILRIQKKE